MRIIDADSLRKKAVMGETEKSGRTYVVELEDVEREVTVDPNTIVSEKSGRTVWQLENDVEFFKTFDEWLQENLEGYDDICARFARFRTEEALRKAGMPEEEIQEICDGVSASIEQEKAAMENAFAAKKDEDFDE